MKALYLVLAGVALSVLSWLGLRRKPLRSGVAKMAVDDLRREQERSKVRLAAMEQKARDSVAAADAKAQKELDDAGSKHPADVINDLLTGD